MKGARARGSQRRVLATAAVSASASSRGSPCAGPTGFGGEGGAPVVAKSLGATVGEAGEAGEAGARRALASAWFIASPTCADNQRWGRSTNAPREWEQLDSGQER